MKKINFILMILYLFTISGCREEADWVKNEIQRNRADEFFRNSNESVKQVNRELINNTIAKLKKFNNKTDFLSKLTDQAGLPMWNHIIEANVENYDMTLHKGQGEEEVLIIPLKQTGNYLSSLMYVENPDSDTPQIYTITNEQLKSFVYDTNVEENFRERILMTFLYFDNSVFGRSDYGEIPLDLFDAVPSEVGEKFKSINIDISSTVISGLVVQICYTIHHCVGCSSSNNCDGCHLCQTTFCDNLGGGGIDMGGNNGDGTSGNNGNNGNENGGGGGGEGTGNENPENTDPCSDPNSPWYTHSSCGNGNGNGNGNSNANTPCGKIKNQRADTEFSSRITDLQGKTGLKKETGYIQKNSGSYEYKDNASATEQNNSLSLPDPETNTYIKGYMHTHINDFEDSDGLTRKGVKIFSPADMTYFMDLVKIAEDAARPLGEVYATMVSSNINYQIRFTGNQYQIKTFTGAQRDAFKDPYTILMGSRIGNQNLLELGFLQFISEKMNLKGITLYRMNSDGTNTEIKLNTDKTGTLETNCPN